MDWVEANIDRFGSTSEAGIALALDGAHRSERLKGSDIVLLEGFGAGVSWARVMMRW
ncbi:MAG TPA: 3-oxoacyl-[acyl-carrier-protein] synthase III C-terminal domain-containing protein [Syntrophobacteria bacterium]|nr:3-oxoacyl-[acyl-carrier-protein] synthase III C-terminal domain-containing protein [Syntrophobacteria bacterium]